MVTSPADRSSICIVPRMFLPVERTDSSTDRTCGPDSRLALTKSGDHYSEFQTSPGISRHDSATYTPPAPANFRCWKHSLQNTGRPCVGRNGTVVSLPHAEHWV